MPRSPSRRAFAALAVSALAGCLSDSSSDSANGGDQNGSDPESSCTQSIESPEPYPDIDIASDPVPADVDVSICVTPIEPFSDESPARIRFEFTNVSEQRQEYGFGFSPPFSPYPADHLDADAALLVLPDDREHITPHEGSQFVPEEPTDGCWRARTGYGANDIGRGRELDPGETLSGEYTLLASPEGDCLALGTYRTEQDYYPDEATWGFEITLS